LPKKVPKNSSAAPAFPKLLLRLRYSFLTLSPFGSLQTTEAALRYDSLNFTETLLRRRFSGDAGIWFVVVLSFSKHEGLTGWVGLGSWFLIRFYNL